MATKSTHDSATSARLQVVRETLRRPYSVLRGHRMGEISAVVLLCIIVLAIVAPAIVPHDPLVQHENSDGTLKALESPSLEHPLGTTRYGRDIFSQLLVGARAALLVGLLTAIIVVTIGTSIGVTAGYYGGYVDSVLMRFTDVFYGVPLLPFAIVALTILDRSIFAIILMIGFIYWRDSARIIRSEVLSLKQEEFIQRAKTTGASNRRIIYKQVLPNVLPISLLYFAFATGYAIITAASIAFLGFGDPNRISWGRMIFEAWSSSAVFRQPFWVAGPGLLIVLTVASVYFIGQTYEEVANPRLRDR